ncbi:MAG: hypothetical protein ABI647_26780, partial [Gemmatimonadota bacterium]
MGRSVVSMPDTEVNPNRTALETTHPINTLDTVYFRTVGQTFKGSIITSTVFAFVNPEVPG